MWSPQGFGPQQLNQGAAMADKLALNHLPQLQQLRKPACAVCWEDFEQTQELDNHIRTSHPDRICDQEELFTRREVA
jgi:hypothetical protein